MDAIKLIPECGIHLTSPSVAVRQAARPHNTSVRLAGELLVRIEVNQERQSLLLLLLLVVLLVA